MLLLGGQTLTTLRLGRGFGIRNDELVRRLEDVGHLGREGLMTIHNCHSSVFWGPWKFRKKFGWDSNSARVGIL